MPPATIINRNCNQLLELRRDTEPLDARRVGVLDYIDVHGVNAPLI